MKRLDASEKECGPTNERTESNETCERFVRLTLTHIVGVSETTWDRDRETELIELKPSFQTISN